ncbi:PQQ-binding-like beta-propeller repeat protein [Salinirubrum litoreum]|uniref:PQQ-binding-like beta-propeller repeat protein n=1 Tax=Salinirubrum litoreum TaxID=1126234 RepID=A0ABD5RBF4_9EURY|nr:PQQ-binding-like beta-propeller repeat protein [Salinirubrum litoreum]
MPSRRDLLAGLAGAGLAGTAGCLAADDPFSAGDDATTDWPMARHDPANTAYAPDAVAPRTGVTERWSRDPDADVRTPAVADGTVFTPGMAGLTALDAATGETLWRYAPGEQAWPAPPTVVDGVVYVTMLDEDSVHAVDAETGDDLWTVTGVAAGDVSPHLYGDPFDDADSPLVVGGEDGLVVGLDPATGEERWRLDVFGRVRRLAHRHTGLYVGTTGGAVYAFSTASGDRPHEWWRTKVDSRVDAIVPADNGVVVSTFGGPLTNLRDGHGGTTDWTAERRHARSPPVKASSWVYSAGWDSVSALRVYDKNLQWRAGGDFGSTAPVAAGDTLYVPSQDTIHAYDLAGGTGGGGLTFGAERWSQTLDADFVQGLAVGDGALFVACEARDGGDSLFRLDPA